MLQISLGPSSAATPYVSHLHIMHCKEEEGEGRGGEGRKIEVKGGRKR